MASQHTNLNAAPAMAGIRVTVDYWAQLRDAAGRGSEIVHLPSSCTVTQLLARLADLHGEPFRGLLLDEAGRPRRSNLIMIGDRVVATPDSLELPDGVTVVLLSPLAGG
ncbi:MAG: MoaD/ThiS family protein [Tepidisphaerales bacterium]